MATSLKKVARYLLMVGMFAMAGVRASADPISDSLTVLDPKGHIFAQVSVTEANEDPKAILFINIPGLANPAQFGNATTLLDLDGSFSDIFGVVKDRQGNMFLGFNSDGEGVPAAFGGSGSIFVPEGSGGFGASMYLSPSFQKQGYTATFFSDPAVPEPASFTLLGIGAAGLFGYGWRRHLRSAA
jgi:hypothetical protein